MCYCACAMVAYATNNQQLPLERQTMSTTTENTRIESDTAVVTEKVKLVLGIEAVKAGE